MPDVTAISLTEVMKAVKFSTNQSSTLDTVLNVVGVEDGVERSFWELLHNDKLPTISCWKRFTEIFA